MKTITLTESEIKTLSDYLWCNPCSSDCICGYTKIDCGDTKDDGEYKCRLKRDTYNIIRKLELI